MKIRLLVLLVITFAGVVSMSSCIKSYSCHCSLVYSGYPQLPPNDTVEYEIKDSKANAKSKCSAQSGNYSNNGINTVETCYLY